MGRDADRRRERVRGEQAGDRAAIHDLLARAFPSDAEARLVDALRGRTRPQIARVAERDGVVVGYILFTPVQVHTATGPWQAMGLAPVAVLPEVQREGIGAALVEAGLSACRDLGEPVVVVLGHADYYPRFGFRPAWDAGLFHGAPGPTPSFMVCELEPGALRGRSGEVRYHPAFDAL